MAALPSLPDGADLPALQAWIDAWERERGWRDASAARCCFQLGEEIGELFAAVRRWERDGLDTQREAVGEEIVDCLNFLFAIANRADVDLDTAFRAKNARNQRRSWPSDGR